MSLHDAQSWLDQGQVQSASVVQAAVADDSLQGESADPNQESLWEVLMRLLESK